MLTPFTHLRGCSLAASDGEIGEVREFYFDDESWSVRYLVVETGSWLNGRRVLIIPDVLGEIDTQGGAIAVKLSQEEVRNSPPIDSDKPVSRQEEEKLHRHYDWNPYWLGGAAGWSAVAPAAMLGAQTGVVATVPPEEAREPRQEERGDPHLRSSGELADRYAFHAQDGEIGRVHDFIVDDEDWCVRYLVARTGLWFGKDVLLALEWIERIAFESAEIFVNLPRSALKDAPEYDSKSRISRAFEERLHDHYRRKPYWDAVAAAARETS